MRWAWPWAAAATGAWCAPAPSRARSWPSSSRRMPPSCRPCCTTSAIPFEGQLILRRIVTADGRSRAFVNDVAVGTGLLRQLGDLLVEVHGQFDQRGLLDPQAHRAILDAFGGLVAQAAARPGGARQLACGGRAGGGPARAAGCGPARGGLSAPPRARAGRSRAPTRRGGGAGGPTARLDESREAGGGPRRGAGRGERRWRGAGAARRGGAPDRAQRRPGGRAAGAGRRRAGPRAGRGRRGRGGAGDRAAQPGGRRRHGGPDRGAPVRAARRGAGSIAWRSMRCPSCWPRRRRCSAKIDASAGDLAAAERTAEQALQAYRSRGARAVQGTRQGGRTPGRRGAGRAAAAAAGAGTDAGPARPAARGGVGAGRGRAGGVRGLHQSGPAVRPDRQDRLGRRAVALHAGAEGGAGPPRRGGDADLRRGRCRHRRRHRRRGGRAAGPPGRRAAGSGGHPRGPGGGPCRPSFQCRQAGRRRQDARRGARAGPAERRDEIARMLAGAEVTEAARAAASSLLRVAGPG